jgi:hypothetical protein
MRLMLRCPCRPFLFSLHCSVELQMHAQIREGVFCSCANTMPFRVWNYTIVYWYFHK